MSFLINFLTSDYIFHHGTNPTILCVSKQDREYQLHLLKFNPKIIYTSSHIARKFTNNHRRVIGCRVKIKAHIYYSLQNSNPTLVIDTSCVNTLIFRLLEVV